MRHGEVCCGPVCGREYVQRAKGSECASCAGRSTFSGPRAPGARRVRAGVRSAGQGLRVRVVRGREYVQRAKHHGSYGFLALG